MPSGITHYKEPRECVICGTRFHFGSNSQKTCSERCSREHYREKDHTRKKWQWANDPEHRERKRTRANWRYWHDPEYRERRLDAAAKREAMLTGMIQEARKFGLYMPANGSTERNRAYRILSDLKSVFEG